MPISSEETIVKWGKIKRKIKVCRVCLKMLPSVVDHLIYFCSDRYVEIFFLNDFVIAAMDYVRANFIFKFRHAKVCRVANTLHTLKTYFCTYGG